MILKHAVTAKVSNLISNKEEAMSTNCSVIVAAIVMISFALAGCGHDTLEKNWGSAFDSARQNQIASPDASQNLEPVVGLDGPAAKKAMDDYQTGRKGREDDTTYNLRLGTIEGIGEKSR